MTVTQIGIAVVENRGRFLIGPRSATTVLGGKWEFPGGKVEPGESPDEAAVRECHEETGLNVRLERLLVVHEQAYDYGTVELHFYLCRMNSVVTPKSPFQWVLREDLGDFDFPSGNAKLLAMLRADLVE